jgi:inosose dehydratase
MRRREFLGAMGGAAALAACGDNLVPGRFWGLDPAIQTWTLRAYSVDDALGMIASLGLTRAELSPQAGHLGYPATDDQIAAMRAKLAANGLDCVTSGLEPVSGDADANRAVFEYAKKLGLRTIMVDAPPESLDSLDELVGEYNVRIGIHNHGVGTRYSTIADVQAALAGRDRRIGCIIDTGHYTRAGVDPIEALHTFAGRVYGVHLKDVAAANPAAPDTILGEGVLDLVGVLRALREIRFPADASLSIEYEANLAPYDDLIVALDHLAIASRQSY